MGAWGTGILQNDTTADIWAEFKELYNKGLSSKEIRKKIETEYKPQNDREYYGEIWTGIAYGQWMCGELENYTLKKLEASVNSKWLILWADDKQQLQKRINTIVDFIKKIKIPRAKAIKRTKIIDRPIIFKTGDVIALKIDKKNFLTAIVVGHSDHPTHGENKIIFTDLLFNEKPTKREILKSKVLYLDVGGKYYYHRGFFWALFSARNMVKKIKDTIKIDHFKINDYLALGSGVGIGNWNEIDKLYSEQIEFLKNKSSERPFDVTVADLLKPKKALQSKLIEWDKKLFQEAMERRRKELSLYR